MNRWFRFYDDALDDPKVQRLAPNLFRAWVNLLCIASKNNGALPSVEDITFKLRMSENDAKSAIEDLILAGLIDISANGEMRPHNWNERQFASDTSKDRTRKWREKKGKTDGDVTVTASDEKCDGIETETYTDSDTDLVPSSESMPRAKELSFNLDLTKGKARKGNLERLADRAEGLGLPVDEFVEILNKRQAKNRPAYFTQLCVNHLQQKVPGLEDSVIRDALWNGGQSYGAVCQAVLVAEAA